MKEQVNHPDHYNIPGKRECIEAMREDYGDIITSIFCLTSAYKYIYRAGLKDYNSQAQDIAKAKWYYDYIEKLKFKTNDILLVGYMTELDKCIREEFEKYGCEN